MSRDETFYQLPAVMPVPHRPQSDEDLLRWAKEMHAAIYDNHIPQVDRIENMIMVGETLDERPAAIGSRRLFYHLSDEDQVLYIDVGRDGESYWDAVLNASSFKSLTSGLPTGSGSELISLNTDDFDEVLSEDDENVQLAMDTIDDHLHIIVEVADSEPADEALENGHAVFWFLESLEV